MLWIAWQNNFRKSNCNCSLACSQHQSSPDKQRFLATDVIVSNGFRSFFFDVNAILAKQCQRFSASYLLASLFQVSVLLFVKLCNFFPQENSVGLSLPGFLVGSGIVSISLFPVGAQMQQVATSPGESMQTSMLSGGREGFFCFIYKVDKSIKGAPPLLSMQSLWKLTVMGALLTSVVCSHCPVGFRKESVPHFMRLMRTAITF